MTDMWVRDANGNRRPDDEGGYQYHDIGPARPDCDDVGECLLPEDPDHECPLDRRTNWPLGPPYYMALHSQKPEPDNLHEIVTGTERLSWSGPTEAITFVVAGPHGPTVADRPHPTKRNAPPPE